MDLGQVQSPPLECDSGKIPPPSDHLQASHFQISQGRQFSLGHQLQPTLHQAITQTRPVFANNMNLKVVDSYTVLPVDGAFPKINGHFVVDMTRVPVNVIKFYQITDFHIFPSWIKTNIKKRGGSLRCLRRRSLDTFRLCSPHEYH